MNNQLIVTVTTAAGKPTFSASDSLSVDDLRTIVRDRFGMQVADNSHAIPHSFCAGLVPAPSKGHAPRTISLLVNPRHLRAI
jgi:hypothetical protein